MIQSALSDILHVLSQGLIAPVIAILLAMMAYALFCIGSVIAEYFTERKHFQVVMPKFLAALMAAKQDEIPQVIEDSGLLNRQKAALLTVYDYRMLPGDALVALIKRLVNEEETRYDRVTGRNNVAARVAPMVGLMGTLIPLGPGIEALGRSEVDTLSSSLLVAFDTTVAGLIVAAVCLIVGKIRSNWYDNYLSALDAAMATMLEKIEEMREAGEIKTEEPTDYAFMFQQRVEARSGKGTSSAQLSKDAASAQPKATTQPAAAAQPATTTQPVAETAKATPSVSSTAFEKPMTATAAETATAAATAATATAQAASTAATAQPEPVKAEAVKSEPVKTTAETVSADTATSFFGEAAPTDPAFLSNLETTPAVAEPLPQSVEQPEPKHAFNMDFEPRKDPLAGSPDSQR